MPALSVVIPTHKRADILQQCIHCLERQTIADDLDIIVVSDGHDDETAALFVKDAWRIPMTFLEVEKSQQGVARNRGVALASAPLVLFIGDDIFLEPDACEHHVAAHATRRLPQTDCQQAVLGHTTWDPAAGITQTMRWLERSGWQFGYPMLEKYRHQFLPPGTQHLFTYASHISLPTALARRFPFPGDTRDYGWEDIAWGRQLAQAGVGLFYEPAAKALHHHHIDLEASLQRMEILGRTARHYPAIARVPRGWKRCAYELAALLPTMAGKHRRAFLRGIKRETNKRINE